MINDKWITRIILTIATIIFLVAGFISVAHTITLWDISNEGYYGVFLGGITFLGIILSLLVALKKEIEDLLVVGYTIFFLTLTMELIGNIYYNYTVIDVNSSAFISFSNLTEPIFGSAFIDNYTFYVKTGMAVVFGIIIPVLHILSFMIIRKIVANEQTKEEQESKTEEVKEEKLAISDKDKDFEIIKTLDNKKKILTNKREVKTWIQKQK